MFPKMVGAIRRVAMKSISSVCPLSIFLTCLVLSSCSINRGLKATVDASAQFHSLVDAGKFEETYSDTTDHFKQQTSRDEFVKRLRRIDKAVGNCAGVTVTRVLFNSNNRGGFGSLADTRDCERGKLYENFRWQVASGKVLLESYSASRSF
jgi:hypothetical protein